MGIMLPQALFAQSFITSETRLVFPEPSIEFPKDNIFTLKGNAHLSQDSATQSIPSMYCDFVTSSVQSNYADLEKAKRELHQKLVEKFRECARKLNELADKTK